LARTSNDSNEVRATGMPGGCGLLGGLSSGAVLVVVAVAVAFGEAEAEGAAWPVTRRSHAG
jgi:hypothetical protein